MNSAASVLVYESDLPETAKDLVRLVGWDGARALIKELGGVPFPVPKAPNNNRQGAARYERLVEIVGEDGADRIVAEYGDDVLNVPNCKVAFSKAKGRAISAFYDRGATLEETARAFGVTTRWVSIVLKQVRTGKGSALEFSPPATDESRPHGQPVATGARQAASDSPSNSTPAGA